MNNDRRPSLQRGGRSETPLLYHAVSDESGHGKSKSQSKPHSRRSSPSATSRSPFEAAGTTLHPPMSASSTSHHRPQLSRQSTMHSRNPKVSLEAAAAAARKKYVFAAFFLAISLVAFCVQTELSAHIQGELGWSKAYCMMYLTHTSWIVLWPVTIFVLRLQKNQEPWEQFWRKHLQVVLSTVTMIELQTINVIAPSVARRGRPVMYLARMTIYITSALTIAGLSWYIAVSLTTPSDLTAIYNCSAFFAYAFSVPILKEPLRMDKSISVLIAILGVLIVAYGDTGGTSDGATSSSDHPGTGSRFAGNLIIGVGSVLYGLYEVLYKRYACPPEGVSAIRGTIFANVFGSCIGFFTLTVLWIPIPFLHWFHIERFEVPEASTCWLILVAILSNATFSGSFLVLISLTSPVLSSVAALLTIFIVALADWILTGQPLSWAAIMGGSMIIVAFLALSWSTYREMMEHEALKLAVDLTDSEDEGDMESDEDQA